MNTNIQYIPFDNIQNSPQPDEDEHQEIDLEVNLKKIPSYRENEGIINQLVQMGFTLRAAMLCTQLTGSNDLDYVLQYVTADEHGYYNHPFLDEGPTRLCIICSDHQSKHVESVDPRQYEMSNSNPPRKLSISSNMQRSQVRVEIAIKEEQKRELIDPVTCTVCYEDVERTELVKYGGKFHDICSKCFVGYLETQIMENKVLKIVCPHCSEELQENTIKDLVPQALYRKFKTFVRNIRVNSDPLSKWCPNPKCSEVIVLLKKDAPKAKCEFCDTEICGKCGRNYHGKTSCEKQLDAELKSWLSSKDASQCPKCGMYVEKAAGCNHMTCQVCRYEWCWLCGSTYTSLHFMNPFGCMGLQGGRHTAKNWGWCRRFFYRICIILAMLAALPFVAVFGFPIFFCVFISETRFYRRNIRNSGCCIEFLFLGLGIFPLGVLLNCIVVPLAIVSLPFVLIGLLIIQCYEKYRLKQRSHERIRQHQANQG